MVPYDYGNGRAGAWCFFSEVVSSIIRWRLCVPCFTNYGQKGTMENTNRLSIAKVILSWQTMLCPTRMHATSCYPADQQDSRIRWCAYSVLVNLRSALHVTCETARCETCVSKLWDITPGCRMLANGLVDQLSVGQSNASIRPVSPFMSERSGCWQPTRFLAKWDQAKAVFRFCRDISAAKQT